MVIIVWTSQNISRAQRKVMLAGDLPFFFFFWRVGIFLFIHGIWEGPFLQSTNKGIDLQIYHLVLIPHVNDIPRIHKRIRIGSILYETRPSDPSTINNTYESMHQNYTLSDLFWSSIYAHRFSFVILGGRSICLDGHLKGPRKWYENRQKTMIGKDWLLDWSSRSLFAPSPVFLQSQVGHLQPGEEGESRIRWAHFLSTS